MNEVDAAGNTPLHSAAFEGWQEGCEYLLSLGAKINASNNAGDRPWHWAQNMGHQDVMKFLEQVGVRALVYIKENGTAVFTTVHSSLLYSLPPPQNGASKDAGQVLVQDHIPKVKDFFQKECWAHHPKPHQEYIDMKKQEDAAYEAERNKLIPGM